MKLLLKLTALIEAATGLGLITVPAVVVRLLLGSELLGAGIPLGRLTGVALLTLGIVCWLASSDTQSCAARGIVTAMTLYNIGAVLILACADGYSSRGHGRLVRHDSSAKAGTCKSDSNSLGDPSTSPANKPTKPNL
jgi:hypothetical protein